MTDDAPAARRAAGFAALWLGRLWRRHRLVLGLLALAASTPVAAADPDDQEWRTLSPNLHIFAKDGCNSIVVVGRGEALVMDTYTEAQAALLKDEIAQRFRVPVRYVVYSHAHADHLRGSAVFGDTPTYIAQRRQRDRLTFLRRLEPSIHPVSRYFDRSLTLRVGGVAVHLEDYGLNHATGVTVMRVPAARAIVVPDIVYPRRLLWYGLNDYSPRGILATLRAVDATSYEVVVPSHGPTFGRPELREFIGYLDDLTNQVAGVIRDNLNTIGPEATLSIALKRVDLSRYRDWGYYKEWRDANIEGTFQSLYVGW